MSKKVVDTPIYVDTYKLVGIVYGLRFSIPKRDRAVLGDRLLDTATAMLVEFTLSYKLRGNEKVVHTDRFLAHFEVLKGLMRLCIDKKVLPGKKCVMTCNYTRDAWIVHMDLKGYFPNEDVEIALAQQLDIIDRYYIGDDEADIMYMMESCMRADPARNCKVYVPRSNWSAIAPEKSLFNKPVGTGGAIGFLCWQNAMGHYINNVVKRLETFGFLRVVVFVDDIYIVTTDKAKFFSMMPEIRSRLSALKVQLNERKFYCQHYSKGVHILGSRVKFDREYADNGTVCRAFAKINEWKRARNVQWKTARLLSSMNTYVGILRTKDMRNVAERFRREVLTSFRRYLQWNDKKSCFALRVRYGFRAVLRRKYKVRL